MTLLQATYDLSRFGFLTPDVFLIFIGTSLGMVGIINTGRNNMANTVRANLQIYRNRLSDTNTEATVLATLQRDIEKDLLVYSKACILFHFTIIIAILQIIIGVTAACVNDSVISIPDARFNFWEGFLVAIMVAGAFTDIIAFITVLFDRRQNPFTSIWN